MIVGEEIHDQAQNPQKNHLLVFGANREMATLAHDPQGLIDRVNKVGGLSFLAHPIDYAALIFGEPDLAWENWEVHGYTGIELWNTMTEFKSLLKSKMHALFFCIYAILDSQRTIP